MDFPVQTTLMYFAKICDEKKEFAGFDKNKVKGFFYKIEKDYPNIFDSMTERTLEDELSGFGITSIIQSINPRYHPHFISPGMSKVWFKRHEKEYKNHDKDFMEIAQKFYNEVGCNFRGELGKRTKIFDE